MIRLSQNKNTLTDSYESVRVDLFVIGYLIGSQGVRLIKR